MNQRTGLHAVVTSSSLGSTQNTRPVALSRGPSRGSCVIISGASDTSGAASGASGRPSQIWRKTHWLPRVASKPLGDRLCLKFHLPLLFLWNCPVKSYSSEDVSVFLTRGCVCVGHAAATAGCGWQWASGAPLPSPAWCACAGDASSDSVTQKYPPPPPVSYRHKSPSPVFLFLFWHVGGARTIVKCCSLTRGPQGTMEFWLCHCDLEGVQRSSGAGWWPCCVWSLLPSTLPSSCDSRQRLDVNVWFGYGSGKLCEFQRIITGHGISFFWFPPPSQLKIGRSLFAQGLYKNRWQTRFGNFITVPPGVPGLWSWLTCWW